MICIPYAVGSCGYGMLSKSDWPYWSVAALPTSNVFFNNLPLEGCGSCWEIECVDRYPFEGRCNADPNQRKVSVQITDQCPECGGEAPLHRLIASCASARTY